MEFSREVLISTHQTKRGPDGLRIGRDGITGSQNPYSSSNALYIKSALRGQAWPLALWIDRTGTPLDHKGMRLAACSHGMSTHRLSEHQAPESPHAPPVILTRPLRGLMPDSPGHTWRQNRTGTSPRAPELCGTRSRASGVQHALSPTPTRPGHSHPKTR